MTYPTIDNRISLGNVLVVLGMVVSIAMAWGNLSGRADKLAETVAANTADIATAESRLRTVEQAQARQDERMLYIIDSLNKIASRLEKIETRLERQGQ